MESVFLQIISGVQVGRRIRVGDRVTLGRNADNHVCFQGPDGSLVSGRHAVIERQDETYILKDVGSTNGTYVNGEQITEQVLSNDQIISLGVSGPKLRVLQRTPGLAKSAEATSLQSTARPSGPQSAASSLEDKLAKTEFEPKTAKGGGNVFGGLFGPSAANPGEDMGNYTMGLAHRLKNDEADHTEFQNLIKDKHRAQRLATSGVLSKRDAMMIQSAAHTYSSHRTRAWWILGSVSVVALAIVSILAYQNMGYRGKVKQQDKLLTEAKTLEAQLAETKMPGHHESDEEKQLLVAKLRAAERQLVSVRANLKSTDLISTYKNPLGREIHAILESFGKKDYIVPDIFVKQVEKHIHTFTKTSTRNIMNRSFANKAKYHKLIESELIKAGMPLPFFYLAMHESMLDSNIISRSGARGIWQFMPGTARDYGLNVPKGWEEMPAENDDRTNPLKSTRAGIKYVKTLYAEFGDVALAMAAYNAGEGRIRKALRSIDDPVNNRDFWYIYRLGILADETNQYVPKIIATMVIDKNRARYGFGP